MSYKVHTVETAPEPARETITAVTKAYGFLPNLIGVMAESPALMKAYRQAADLFDETSLTPAERQVVLLTVSFENGCDYCVAAHTVIAGMQKVPTPVVQAVRAGQPIGDARLEALRRFVSSVVINRGRPSAADTAAFLRAGFAETQVLEVVLGVGVKTLSNYTNHIAETPLDPAFASAAWTKAA
jgi:uncharacterized peroxidase-related enzyme